jgi:hypothetical protein
LLSIIFNPELNVVSFNAAFVSFFAGAGLEGAVLEVLVLDTSTGLGGSGAALEGAVLEVLVLDISTGLGGSGTGSTGGGAGFTGSAGAGAGSDFAGSLLSPLEEQLDTRRRRPAMHNSSLLLFIGGRV